MLNRINREQLVQKFKRHTERMKGEPRMEKIGTETETLYGLQTCLELQSSSVRLKGEQTRSLPKKNQKKEES